jgi:hypothetical protein
MTRYTTSGIDKGTDPLGDTRSQASDVRHYMLWIAIIERAKLVSLTWPAIPNRSRGFHGFMMGL